MKRILFHGLSWGWLLFVIFLILLAISITFIRVAAPMLTKNRAAIESQISEIIDRPVVMESIAFSMQKFYPVVRVNGVKILSREERKPVFDFDELTLVVNPWQSLLKRSLIPSDIVLSGSHLSFVRKLDGGITVSGFKFGSDGEMPKERLDLLTDLTFQLSDIEVYWQDDPLGTAYQFAAKKMQVRVSPKSIDLQGEIKLPEGMGDNIDLTLNIRGPVTNYLAWDGEFYINTTLLDLPVLPLEFAEKLPIVENGTAALTAWGNWYGKKIEQITGNLALKDLLIRPLVSKSEEIPPLFRLDRLQTRFHAYEIDQGWQLDTDQTRITSLNKSWPESNQSLSLQKFSEQWFIRGSTAYLDISTLKNLLNVALSPESEFLEQLENIEPSGQVYNLLYSWWNSKPGRQRTYAVSGEFSSLGWKTWKSLPGMENLDGTFDLDHDDGKLLLSSQGSGVDIPKLFQQSLWIDSVNSELIWQLKDDGAWLITAENFSLENEDVQVRGEAELKIGPETGSPELILEAGLSEFKMEKVRQYLPLEILPEKTGQWLSQAFVEGQVSNAKFSYNGRLSGADFKSGQATMLASADVAEATLEYRKDWPDIQEISGKVNFKNASMSVEANAASVSDSQLKTGSAVIADFYRPELKLDLAIDGPLPGALKYLRAIPVSRGMENVIDAAETTGDVDVALKLDIPLAKKLNKKTSVDGRIHFKKNTLAFPENDIKLSNIDGVFDFTEKNYTAENITGEFRGSVVEVDVKTQEGTAVDIDISGIFSTEQLLPGNALLPKIAEGKSHWNAAIKVPSRKQRAAKKLSSLQVTSRLKGTRIIFPAPLGKISLVERDFFLEMPLGKSQPEITFDYAPVLFGKIKLAGKGREATVDNAVISLSEQSLRLPESGIDIIGHWPMLHTSSWLKRFIELAKPGEDNLLGGQVNRVSISLSELFVAGQQFSNVQLTAARNENFWRANINGDSVSGFLRIPQQKLTDSVLEADFEKLYLKKSGTGGEAVSPRDLPAFKVSIDDFHWQDVSLGQLQLNTEKDLWGMQLNQLSLSSNELSVQATGQWRQDDQGLQHTKLDFGMQGNNMGKTLSELEISKTLTGGKGNLQGSINWDDAPYKLAFASWNGDMTVNVEEGRLSKLSPGFGRVLGLLNVDQLPKRLALQFSDVSGEGFQIGKLGGKVSLVDGDAYMQNFKIDSTAAEMNLSGSINLPQQLYNLDLVVIPKITGTAPLAAGLIAGPQAGAVVYLVDKLASSAGVDLNKAIEQEYRITGTWEEPLVESISIENTEEEPLSPEE